MNTNKPLIVIGAIADVASRRRMVEGIAHFIAQKDDWDVLCVTHTVETTSMGPLFRQADGIILAQESAADDASIAKMGKPSVVIGHTALHGNSVIMDEREIGAIAAEHFRSIGLRSAAFCGLTAPFSVQRRDGLAQRASRLGLGFTAYPRNVYAQMDNDPHELSPFHRWLTELPRPTGLLCTTCEVAHNVLHHCRRLDLRVPNDIAVLGVDDDELMCEITRPHLSTIDDGSFDAGYRAAQLLDTLLKDPGRRPTQIVVKPRPQVIARESTDLVFADSPAIGQALRYVRDHAYSQLDVSDILKHVPISRRALERGFARNVGRTVHQEILRLRLARARALLANTDLKLPHIAERSGFSSAGVMCNVFRRDLETTPAQYRRRSRSGG